MTLLWNDKWFGIRSNYSRNPSQAADMTFGTGSDPNRCLPGYSGNIRPNIMLCRYSPCCRQIELK
jgi:hypothetical protein